MMWGGSSNESAHLPKEVANPLAHGLWPAGVPPYFQNFEFLRTRHDISYKEHSIINHPMSYLHHPKITQDTSIFWHERSEWDDSDFDLTMRFHGVVHLVSLVESVDFVDLREKMSRRSVARIADATIKYKCILEDLLLRSMLSGSSRSDEIALTLAARFN